MQCSEIFNRNMRFFATCHSGFFDLIKDCLPGEWVQVIDSRISGTKTILYPRGDVLLPLHSKFNPEQEAATWAKCQNLQDKRHVLLFGLGFGYHVEQLIRLHPNLVFHIYEPDRDIFLHTMCHKDWSTFPWNNIKCFELDDGTDLHERLIRSIVGMIKEDWCFLTIPAFERCFSDALAKFGLFFEDRKREVIDHLATNIGFQKEWTVNALKNFPYLRRYYPIEHYKPFFQGQTVVMTASGPSLNEAIPYLREIKEKRKAIIVAAGSSINGLNKHGIVPDVFVSYDPFVVNYEDIQPFFEADIPFFAASTIFPGIIRDHKKSKAYFVSSQDTVFDYLLGNIEPNNIVPDAPSIAAITLVLLVKMGVNNVILTGQDLAYYRGLRYADGISPYFSGGKAWEVEENSYISTVSNLGEEVFTSPSFNLFRNALESIVKQADFFKIINTSPNGAKIKGVPYQSWDEVISKLSDQCFESPLVLSERPGYRQHIRKAKKKILNSLEMIRRQSETLQNNVKIVTGWSEEVDAGQIEALFKNTLHQLSILRSGNGYQSLIKMMVRNEEYIIDKYIDDALRMSSDEKKEFIQNWLLKLLNGVMVSHRKLLEAVNDWPNMDEQRLTIPGQEEL